jgi:hypothetical protein
LMAATTPTCRQSVPCQSIALLGGHGRSGHHCRS